MSKRRKTSSVQSCRSTQAWLWEVGFVFGERGGCETWSWALQTTADHRPAAQSLHVGREGSTEPPASHRLCICCWQCFHSSLFKEGAFWPDLTSKKFKFSKFVKVCLLKSYYKTILIKTMWYEWKQWKKTIHEKTYRFKKYTQTSIDDWFATGVHRERIIFFSKSCWNNWKSVCKYVNFEQGFTPSPKFTQNTA